MKCDEVKDKFLEGSLPDDARLHMQSCAACADAWAEHAKVMALLDEWQAPEASPFFDTRLLARVREAKEQEVQRFSVLALFRRPLFGFPAWQAVAAGALALAMAIGISVMRPSSTDDQVMTARSAAVQDLQTLDRHQHEITTLELLDDLNAADADQFEGEL